MKTRREPQMSFEIEEGIAYTPELQCLVADCRRRANDDFIAYAIGKLQLNGVIEHDWPVHISIQVGKDTVAWSLVSRSGHQFRAIWPERIGRVA